MRSHAARVFLAVFLVFPACAASLELRYDALERIVAEQLFTQEGRRYVRGSQTTKCQYAYLEGPHVSADNGRLRVAARFSGRSAVDLLGHCVGMGDSFDLTVTAVPFPRNGAVALKDVKVTTIRDSYYIRRVRSALADSISKGFKIEVLDQARRLLEQPRDPSAPKPLYQRELEDFQLGDVQVTADALVLVVEFRLVVK
jgi:hypothetical protein